MLIFDLDGTVLSINSFPCWVRAMLFCRLEGLNAPDRCMVFLRTAFILLCRKLLRHSHALTKHRLQKIWAEALSKDPDQQALHAFGAVLRGYIRPNLQPVLQQVKEGKVTAVLATSAAAEYAQAFGKSLGFTHILATEYNQPENNKEHKRARTLAMLETLGLNDRPRIFFTDHEEDLPLISACHLTLWFGKDDEIAKIQTHAPNTKIIACRNLSSAEISALLPCA